MRQSYSKPKVGRFLRHGVVYSHLVMTDEAQKVEVDEMNRQTLPSRCHAVRIDRGMLFHVAGVTEYPPPNDSDGNSSEDDRPDRNRRGRSNNRRDRPRRRQDHPSEDDDLDDGDGGDAQ